MNIDEGELGDPVIRIRNNTEGTKNNRTLRINEIQAEFLRLEGEEATNMLFKLVRYMYQIGKIPEDFNSSIIITLPSNGASFFIQ